MIIVYESFFRIIILVSIQIVFVSKFFKHTFEGKFGVNGLSIKIYFFF